MRLLLDTHALIWFLLDRSRIPSPLARIVVDPAHSVYVSSASTWEASIKGGLGQLHLPFGRLESVIIDAGFAPLPVTIAHTLGIQSLPRLHRDPFDRLLIAQARHEHLTLVTRDRIIQRYPVTTLWD